MPAPAPDQQHAGQRRGAYNQCSSKRKTRARLSGQRTFDGLVAYLDLVEQLVSGGEREHEIVLDNFGALKEHFELGQEQAPIDERRQR